LQLVLQREKVIPDPLVIAVGIPVVLTKNMGPETGLCNGSQGIVEDFITIRMASQRKSLPVVIYQPLVRFTLRDERGGTFSKLVPITEAEYEITDGFDIASVVQLPLLPASAITLHRAQGLTIEKLVIQPENVFSPGQIFVGLSRCVSLRNLILLSPIYPHMIRFRGRSLVQQRAIERHSLLLWEQAQKEPSLFSVDKMFCFGRDGPDLLTLNDTEVWQILDATVQDLKRAYPEDYYHEIVNLRGKEPDVYSFQKLML